MAETYSAGIVTAYGAAVRGGYTGTYDEFCAEQAGFAENAQQVAEDRAAVEQQVSDFGTVTVPAAEQQIAAAGAAQVAAVNAAGQDKETDIAAAGAAQVTRVETTGTQTVGSVETAGSQQVAAVNAAGAAQVAAVAAEGTTQTGAVQAKGQEILDSIPEDYTALVDEVAANKAAFYDTLVLREAPAITIDSVWRSATGTAGSNVKYARTTGKLNAALYNIAEMQSDTYRFGLGFYDVDGNPFGFVNVNTAPETQYVPDDAVQMIVNFNRKDNADMQDSDIEAIQSALKLYGVTDTKLEKPGKAADAQATGEAIGNTNALVDTIFTDEQFDYTDVPIQHWGVSASGKWTYGISQRSYTLPLDGYKRIKVTASSQSDAIIAVLDTFEPETGADVDFADGYQGRITLAPGGSIEFVVRDDRHYFYAILRDTGGVDHTPTVIVSTFEAETTTVINNSYTYNTTVNRTEQVYNNTYNQTVSPTITTDSNGWLQAVDDNTLDETGKTDMAPAIMAMLTQTGYCHLGEGIYYVSGNIDMPANSMLTGCGKGSIIRLLSSVESGYAIKMEQFCTISDLRVSGGYNSPSIASEGTRNGILFSAVTTNESEMCMMSNVWVDRFSGSGIKCISTSANVRKGLYATNAQIINCYAGVNIVRGSEFHKFTNICTSACTYGCINNGGNNVFTACTFHAAAVGFYLDGSQPNAEHGTINGCTFCHIGGNNGIAFLGEAIESGWIISNCQFWYGGIELTNCQGVLFDGCMFGRGIADDGAVSASITIDGGNLILFSGCMFHLDVTRPPKITITNNTKTVFSGCYGTESGLPITATGGDI